MIKFSKTIAIANKESIICGWEFINKLLIKFSKIKHKTILLSPAAVIEIKKRDL